MDDAAGRPVPRDGTSFGAMRVRGPWVASGYYGADAARAQALLGRILFRGEAGLPRQPARGLMWLTLARSNAAPSESWIAESYDSALKQATDEDRALAADYLARWMNAKRD